MALKYVVNLGLLILFVACTGQETSDYTVEAIRTPSPPVIDGIEDDPIWQQITPVVLKENRTGNETRDGTIRTQVKSCYDDHTLYFFFLCTL